MHAHCEAHEERDYDMTPEDRKRATALYMGGQANCGELLYIVQRDRIGVQVLVGQIRQLQRDGIMTLGYTDQEIAQGIMEYCHAKLSQTEIYRVGL